MKLQTLTITRVYFSPLLCDFFEQNRQLYHQCTKFVVVLTVAQYIMNTSEQLSLYERSTVIYSETVLLRKQFDHSANVK